MANVDTNGDGAKKPRVQKTKIIMLDANDQPVMTANNTPSDDPTEARSFTIQVGSLEPIHCKPFEFSEKIRNGLVIFGTKQRFTNAIGNIDPDEAYEKITQIHEQLLEGEDWARTGQGPRIGLLVDAFVKLAEERGAPRDADELRAKLKTKDAAWLNQAAAQDDVASAILQIKADRAKKAADAAKAKTPAKQFDFATI